MPWSASVAVTDCSSKNAILSSAVGGGQLFRADASGVISIVVDDQFSGFDVAIEADGYQAVDYVFTPNTKGAVCLQPASSSPPVSNPHNLVPPVIGNYDVRNGTLTVDWTGGECDGFNVMLSSLVPTVQTVDERELDGKDHSYSRGRLAGAQTYRFSVQRVNHTTIPSGSDASDWVSVDIEVPAARGFISWQAWTQIGPDSTFDHAQQQVSAVTRDAQHIDLFVLGFDDRLWSAYADASGWHGWFQPLPGSPAVFDHTSQRIAAVSRGPGFIDLFVIGFDNLVWSAYWSASGGGWHGWFQPLPGSPAVFDHARQQVVAVSRGPGHIDLFVLGFDNKLYSAYWTDDGKGWHGWFQPLPNSPYVFDHTTEQVTAIARGGGIDLFVIADDNHVWTASWTPSGGWHDWTAIMPASTFDHARQRVAAVTRRPDCIDLFVLGFDNHVWTAYFNGGAWHGWFAVQPASTFDATAQRVAAVSRAPENIDLFVVGYDNTVWSAYLGGTTWNGWFSLLEDGDNAAGIFDHTATHLTAVSKGPDHLDVFAVGGLSNGGNDNRVYTASWNP